MKYFILNEREMAKCSDAVWEQIKNFSCVYKISPYLARDIHRGSLYEVDDNSIPEYVNGKPDPSNYIWVPDKLENTEIVVWRYSPDNNRHQTNPNNRKFDA